MKHHLQFRWLMKEVVVEEELNSDLDAPFPEAGTGGSQHGDVVDNNDADDDLKKLQDGARCYGAARKVSKKKKK